MPAASASSVRPCRRGWRRRHCGPRARGRRGWHRPELVQVDDAALLVDPAAALQELLHRLRLKVLAQVVVAERIVRRQWRRRRVELEPSFSLLVSEPTAPDHLHLSHARLKVRWRRAVGRLTGPGKPGTTPRHANARTELAPAPNPRPHPVPAAPAPAPPLPSHPACSCPLYWFCQRPGLGSCLNHSSWRCAGEKGASAGDSGACRGLARTAVGAAAGGAAAGAKRGAG